MDENTITDKAYKKYVALHNEFCRISNEFMAIDRPLGLELYYPVHCHYSESDWYDVVSEAKRTLPEDAEWDDWKLILDRQVCSRLFGSGNKAELLKEFLDLVTQARDVLCQYADLYRHIPESIQWKIHPAVPCGNATNFFCDSDHEPLSLLEDFSDHAVRVGSTFDIVVGKNTLHVCRTDNICVASADAMESWLPALQPKVVTTTPVWDENTYMLRYQNQDIKKIDRRAFNQLQVIEAFHKQGWPHHINDPFPNAVKYPDPARLHGVVYQLNLKHITPDVIRFKMDNTGRGLEWGETSDFLSPT